MKNGKRARRAGCHDHLRRILLHCPITWAVQVQLLPGTHCPNLQAGMLPRHSNGKDRRVEKKRGGNGGRKSPNGILLLRSSVLNYGIWCRSLLGVIELDHGVKSGIPESGAAERCRDGPAKVSTSVTSAASFR